MIEEFQLERLKTIVEYAYRYSPFYRKLYKKANVKPDDIKKFSDIEKLPVVKMEELRANWEEVIALPYKKFISSFRPKGNLPLKVVWDPLGKVYKEYVFARNLLKLGYNPFYKTLVYSSRNFQKYFFNMFNLFRFITVNPKLSERRQLELIQKLKPKQLLYNPLSLFKIAKIAEEKNIEIPEPNLLITKSEILPPYVKDTIENAFRVKLKNLYGMEEVGFIAWQNLEDYYHVNWDSVIVECLNLKNNEKIVEEKKYGRIVVTSLQNYAMPIIRYDTGDIATVGENDGSVLKIKSIEGKYEDGVYLNGKIITPLVLTNDIIKEVKDLFILLFGRKKITLIVPSDVNEERIKGILKKYNIKKPLRIVREKAIPKTFSGKYYTIIKSLKGYI
jgi:phenylacetate-CoA ligase